MFDFFSFEEQPSTRFCSGLNGSDSQALEILLSVHAAKNPSILDCTFNTGKMWKQIRDHYDVTTLDIDSKYETDFVGDFRHLPMITTKKFDVLVFDPPHLSLDASSEGSSGIWKDQYGLVNGEDTGREGDNINALFKPFFAAAKQVTKSNGVIFCKIIDMVHNHRYQWQHIALIEAAQSEGLTACDLLVKIDPVAGNIKSSKWKNVYHLRRNHCFWVVIRNGILCEKEKSG